MLFRSSSQEKTEQPTEKRLKKAKEDGQVARSKELNTAILLMVSIAGLLWFANLFYSLFVNQERHLYSRDNFKLNRTAALAEWRQLYTA